MGLFESAEQRRRDQLELESLYERYEGDIIAELERRTKDTTLRDRDRKHWSRLLRKARGLYG
jgi:hypothetical protein